jgi:hypothetical protein
MEATMESFNSQELHSAEASAGRAETAGGGPARSDYPRTVMDPRRKSVGLASLLSAFPGLGQIYVGYYRTGFTLAIAVATIIALLNSNAVGGAEPFFGFLLAFTWLYNVIDAGRRAALFNQALLGGVPVQMPEDIAIFGKSGNVVSGVFLLLFGFLMLLQTRFHISLRWFAEWWPLAPIALGLYLLYQARQEQQDGGSSN